MVNLQDRRLIGLTGGIATGKTTVSNYLSQKYQLPILDADIYAREAVAKGSPILKTILARYGDRIMLADGALNRPALGEIVFNNPFVRDRFEQELQRLNNSIIVLDIPLLFEANLTDTVTEIWVVSCSRDRQISRLQQRNGLTADF